MLVTNRFVVDAETVDEFTRSAHAALAALAARPGYLRGELLRALDDPDHWLLVTEWESVGAYRRALGGFDVKVTAVPLLARSVDEPSAYETLAGAAPEGEIVVVASDRAARPYR
ncbi:antibiotic biosynthesis monooxygenase [Micromonospora sp. C28ISP2-4]|uniref:antibiotic biosynthesis monooxygenase family protein n=1 Tax=Micromonospora sp. C28ISP2-4 TaxID=3059523 RepID=UPI002676C4A7|nr:antibiotic biosynthesis monooxygenase family protein [Micromonospora sp. C28ISP2-4]MDO3687510.1 antibiotic biosynthesis monooxygenase family protein [Micromonospora sp. C28ISP2-4]